MTGDLEPFKRKPKTGTKSKEETASRREKVRGYIERLGTWGVSVQALAKELKVDPSTIRNDIQTIIKGSQRETVEVCAFNAENAYKTTIGVLTRFVQDSSLAPKDRIQAANALTNTLDKLNVFLEQYGFKEKIADKLDITAKIPLEALERYIRGEDAPPVNNEPGKTE